MALRFTNLYLLNLSVLLRFHSHARNTTYRLLTDTNSMPIWRTASSRINVQSIFRLLFMFQCRHQFTSYVTGGYVANHAKQTCSMRSTPVWDITQCIVAIPNRSFETTWRSLFQRSRIKNPKLAGYISQLRKPDPMFLLLIFHYCKLQIRNSVWLKSLVTLF